MTPVGRMIHCSPDETLEKVQYIMVELKIRALPVVKDGVIYGIITLGDVINHHYRSVRPAGRPPVHVPCRADCLIGTSCTSLLASVGIADDHTPHYHLHACTPQLGGDRGEEGLHQGRGRPPGPPHGRAHRLTRGEGGREEEHPLQGPSARPSVRAFDL